MLGSLLMVETSEADSEVGELFSGMLEPEQKCQSTMSEDRSLLVSGCCPGRSMMDTVVHKTRLTGAAHQNAPSIELPLIEHPPVVQKQTFMFVIKGNGQLPLTCPNLDCPNALTLTHPLPNPTTTPRWDESTQKTGEDSDLYSAPTCGSFITPGHLWFALPGLNALFLHGQRSGNLEDNTQLLSHLPPEQGPTHDFRLNQEFLHFLQIWRGNE